MKRRGWVGGPTCLLGVLVIAACGAGGDHEGAGGDGPRLASAASPEARALVSRLRALRLAGDKRTAGEPGAQKSDAPVLLSAVVGEVVDQGATLWPRLGEDAPRGGQRRADVALPVRGDGVFRVEDRRSKLSVEVRPLGAGQASAEVVDGYVVYRGAERGGRDVLHRVTSEGTEDFVWFERAPSESRLSYEIKLGEGVAGLRLVASTLELLDAAGAPQLRMVPPYVVDALGEKHAAQVELHGCAHDDDPRGPWGRAVTPPGAERCGVEVTWGDVAYPAVVDPAWVTTGSMAAARSNHTASVLGDGKVLVVGGYASNNSLASAELYDPATGTWSSAASMVAKRYYHSASVVGNGWVLVAGGNSSSSSYLATAELYDPGTGIWSGAASMASARSGHTASTLGDGRVLVAGGTSGINIYLASAELYNPVTAAWTNTGAMQAARERHTASVLGDGKVLVAGGSGSGFAYTASAELYDPATGAWGNTGSMTTLRVYHTATVLGSGRVLVTGAIYNAGAELYDPVAGTWSSTANTAQERSDHTASVLGNGKVLVAGGNYSATAELYDPGSGTWTSAGSMAASRTGHTASVLGSGQILITGGSNMTFSELFAQLPLGGVCSKPGECVSGHCADGFCCDAACSGSCGTCAASLGATADGTCTLFPIGHAGSPVCASPYLCNGLSAACPNACISDANCVAGRYCAVDNTCKPQKLEGATCNAVAGGDCRLDGCAVCASGGCADGFCCDTACAGPCDVCAASLGAVANGVCTTAPSGYLGSPSCGDYLCDGSSSLCPTSCASDTDCAASGFCRASDHTCQPDQANGAACASASACQSGHCVDGVCCDTACDGLCQACTKANKGGAGPDGLCGNVGPGLDPRDDCEDQGAASCSFDGSCNGAGACRLYGTGTACGQTQCVGNTVKGDVCDGAGTCTPNQSGGDCSPFACAQGACKTSCETNLDCAPTFTCNAGLCSSLIEAVCMDDHTVRDGEGNTRDCGNYKCAVDRCNTDCKSIDDCVSPAACDEGKCVVIVKEPSEESAGCGCSLPGRDPRGAPAALILLGLALLRSRRRAWRSALDPRA